jgi:hypothetical protein
MGVLRGFGGVNDGFGAVDPRDRTSSTTSTSVQSSCATMHLQGVYINNNLNLACIDPFCTQKKKKNHKYS